MLAFFSSGSAYELYQRTHKSSTTYEQDDDEDEDDGNANVAGLKVKGRMSRNAARVGCIAGKSFFCIVYVRTT